MKGCKGFDKNMQRIPVQQEEGGAGRSEHMEFAMLAYKRCAVLLCSREGV